VLSPTEEVWLPWVSRAEGRELRDERADWLVWVVPCG